MQRFIGDTSAMYTGDDAAVARAQLIAGYELLRREGDLPKLDEAKYKARWDATMKRRFVQVNVGVNMDIILSDNPYYWAFIMDSQQFFAEPQRMDVLSDLSSGYMFLADNVIRTPDTTVH